VVTHFSIAGEVFFYSQNAQLLQWMQGRNKEPSQHLETLYFRSLSSVCMAISKIPTLVLLSKNAHFNPLKDNIFLKLKHWNFSLIYNRKWQQSPHYFSSSRKVYWLDSPLTSCVHLIYGFRLICFQHQGMLRGITLYLYTRKKLFLSFSSPTLSFKTIKSIISTIGIQQIQHQAMPTFCCGFFVLAKWINIKAVGLSELLCCYSLLVKICLKSFVSQWVIIPFT
jgi:hypothetical protein